jgi:hypothetical protein
MSKEKECNDCPCQPVCDVPYLCVECKEAIEKIKSRMVSVPCERFRDGKICVIILNKRCQYKPCLIMVPIK